jgi:propionyl-CoA carboxylase beta chain
VTIDRSHKDEERIAAQHAEGKLTACERLEILLDANTFDAFAPAQDGDGLIAGSGQVNGRTIVVYAKDFAANGGILSVADTRKLEAVFDMALQQHVPVIGIFDGLGIENDPDVLAALAGIFGRAASASGIVPLISLIAGPCIGADAILAGFSDFIFMSRPAASLFVTGPEVVKALTHEDITRDELGGAQIHAEKSGIADAVYDNDLDALLQIRRLIDFLHREAVSQQSFDDPARHEASLDSLIPDAQTQSYDVKELIDKVLDESDFFELKEQYARNLVTGFGRLAGRTVGVIAHQPLVMGGVYDCAALAKAERFLSVCNANRFPVVSFVDVPGFLPGLAQEQGGIARHAAALARAYANAHVPKLTVVMRNALGAAAAIAGSRDFRAHRVFAWPSARIGLSAAATPDLQSLQERGVIDAIIEPRETRRYLVDALTHLISARGH